MIETLINEIIKSDKDVGAAIKHELDRQRNNIELIASENIVSENVLLAAGSILTNKYAEGYPDNRYYGGCEYIDEIENLAIDRVKALFGSNYANVQPHSGAQANFAVYQALCNVGDTVMGMSLDCGGHLTHGSRVNYSGKNYNIVPYFTNEEGFIDYDEMERIANEVKPKMICAGASAYPRAIDFERCADIAHEVGAYLWVDMAHIAGLVAAGLHQSPIPYADVVTSTTHKTLRGPRGGFILCNDESISKKINSAIFPGSQGGPLEHIIAAKAICFGEASKPNFKEYQKQVIANAKTLSNKLLNFGFNLVTGGTDNHLMLLDLRSKNITGLEMQNRLSEINITVNKNSVPKDPQKPSITSGIRIGTPAITTRGFKEEECEKIANYIYYASLNNFDKYKDWLKEKVEDDTRRFPIYK